MGTLSSKLEERIPLKPIKEAALHKQVPVHKHAFWYYMGGVSLFFFIVQIIKYFGTYVLDFMDLLCFFATNATFSEIDLLNKLTTIK